MQNKLLHIQHANLVQYFAIAVESESPLIKFVVMEEDLGEGSVTLKQLKDCILTNHLLVRYFSEKLYIYSFLVQTLKALQFLNLKDEIHGDLTPMSIMIQLLDDERLLKVKLFDFLKI